MANEIEVQKKDRKYDGSEMDEIESPPIKMILALLFITIIGFLYTFAWALVMNL